ncbi:MAG: hypothetical protein AAF483_29125 [Planctomycetota bacterium]
MAFLDLIDNHDLVTAVYGSWPDFGGAYVVSASLFPHSDRFPGEEPRQFDLVLHWWLGAPDFYPDAPIQYDTAELHRLLHFVFFLPEELRVRTFFCSNASIDALQFTTRGEQLDVECSGGFELKLESLRARVLTVTECDAYGDAIGT